MGVLLLLARYLPSLRLRSHGSLPGLKLREAAGGGVKPSRCLGKDATEGAEGLREAQASSARPCHRANSGRLCADSRGAAPSSIGVTCGIASAEGESSGTSRWAGTSCRRGVGQLSTQSAQSADQSIKPEPSSPRSVGNGEKEEGWRTPNPYGGARAAVCTVRRVSEVHFMTFKYIL